MRCVAASELQLMRCGQVARIDKQLRKMRLELKGDLDRFKHCNKTSARKQEFKQVYEENLVKINEMNVRMVQILHHPAPISMILILFFDELLRLEC